MKYPLPEALEADVINAIAKENPEISDAILSQFKNRTVTGCEISTRGFYINYEVSGAPPINGAASGSEARDGLRAVRKERLHFISRGLHVRGGAFAVRA